MLLKLMHVGIPKSDHFAGGNRRNAGLTPIDCSLPIGCSRLPFSLPRAVVSQLLPCNSLNPLVLSDDPKSLHCCWKRFRSSDHIDQDPESHGLAGADLPIGELKCLR